MSDSSIWVLLVFCWTAATPSEIYNLALEQLSQITKTYIYTKDTHYLYPVVHLNVVYDYLKEKLLIMTP